MAPCRWVVEPVVGSKTDQTNRRGWPVRIEGQPAPQRVALEMSEGVGAAAGSSSPLAKVPAPACALASPTHPLSSTSWSSLATRHFLFPASLGPSSSRTPSPTQSVGKTSIITRFVYDKFDCSYQARICSAA